MKETIILEKTYPVPVARVWDAITDINKLRQWYFPLPEFRLEVGFEYVIGSKTKDKHRVRITEILPGKKLVHTFVNIDQPGMSHVTFELFDEGSQTRFRLTHTGLDTFPTDVPDFAPAVIESGWGYLFGTSLAAYFEQE
jgi:uncharacterized protein YndB with AHSA1/START domain